MARPQTAHGKPTRERTATAPYNFVRLPQQMLPAARLLPAGARPWTDHDRYVPGLLTGWIDLDITTLTPLFIGPPPLSADGRNWAQPRLADQWQSLRSFRFTPDGPPAIPGSTINGLLDTMVRILGFARPDPMWDPRLWMRQPVTVAGSTASRRRGRRYADLRDGSADVTKLPRTAGFLRRGNENGASTWHIEPLDSSLNSTRKRQYPGGVPGNDVHFFPFLEHTAYKVHHNLVTSLTPGPAGWRPPLNDIEYTPQDNRDWVRRRVAFLTADLLTRNTTPFHRVSVVVGLADEAHIASVRALRERLTAVLRHGLMPALQATLETALPPDNTVLAILSVDAVRSGTLVLTGTTGNGRNNEYVFPDPRGKDQVEKLPIAPDFLAANVDHDDQITDWQQRAFPGNPPSRPGAGRFADGDPVWYTFDADEGVVTSFGRASGYRVPYQNSMDTLIPRNLRRPDTLTDLDVRQAMFGDVNLLGRGSLRGRISAGHAHLVNPPSDPAACELPSMLVGLLAPNRQSYSLYLTQPPGGQVDQLRDYDGVVGSDTLAEPRGFKLYPHRWTGAVREQELPAERQKWTQDIVPLRPGLMFRSRLRFTNLAPAELGLLLRAMVLDNDLTTADPVRAHKLGRGRPLGLGSVLLTPTLHLVDPAARYAGVMAAAAADAAVLTSYLDVWDQVALEHAENTDEEMLAGNDWRAIARLRELLLATSWLGRLHPELTKPMEVGMFAEDRVLPGLLDLFPDGRG
jgi:hypothetical protein